MIALTFCSLMLLTALAVQAATAGHFAHRNAARRLRTGGLTIPADHAQVVIARIARRTRVNSAGGAAAVAGATALMWIVHPEPTGAPNLLAVAVLLSALALGGTAAEALHVVRTTAPAPPGVRVAGLSAREPHLSDREALAEKVLVGVAVVLLPLSVIAWVTGADNGAAATVCIAASVATMLSAALTRRWLLARPAPAPDAAEAVGAELTTDLSVDRATEGLVAYGSVLLLYAALVTGVTPFGVLTTIVLFTIVVWATCTATVERSRVRKGATA